MRRTDGLFSIKKYDSKSSSFNKEYCNATMNRDLSETTSNSTVFLNSFLNRSFLICYLHKLMKSFLVQVFLFLIILLSIFLLCIETYADMRRAHQKSLIALDTFCLVVFLVEFICKIIIWRQYYFSDWWNLIDFITIIANLIDLTSNILTITYVKHESLANVLDFNSTLSKSLDSIEKLTILSMVKHLKIFRTLRAFKSLRVLRTIKLLSSLEIILETCINSFQSLKAIFLLMTIILYNFSVVSTSLFRDIDNKRFGNLVNSAFTLFQVITLDDWYIIYKSNSFNSSDDASNNTNAQNGLDYFFRQYFLIGFLMSFLILENFIMLNLFVAVLVDNFHQAREARDLIKSKNELGKPRISNSSNANVQNKKLYRKIKISNIFQKFLAKNFDKRVKLCMKTPLFMLRKNFKNRKRSSLNKFHKKFPFLICRKNSNKNANNNNNENNSFFDDQESLRENTDLNYDKNNILDNSSSDESEANVLDDYKNSLEIELPLNQKNLLERHFQLLASIEFYSNQMSELNGILENLVKIAEENDENENELDDF